MSIGEAVYLIRSGVLETLLLSAPMLIVAVVVGLVISIFQATTSIQEQTLTFAPKIAAILASLIFFGSWIMTSLVKYTVQIFQMIPDMVK